MKIIVKSIKENFIKEKKGLKTNTVRQLDGQDTIEIFEVDNGEFTGEAIERTIKDITVYDDRIIISWEAKK